MRELSTYQFGNFVIDVRERLLRRDGEPVSLTPKAFDLLVALIERPGRLSSKEELLQTVWPDAIVEESNLAYHVFALRKALGDTADNGHYIETVPKRGYRFRAAVTPIDLPPGGPQPPRQAEPVWGDAAPTGVVLLDSSGGETSASGDGTPRPADLPRHKTVSAPPAAVDDAPVERPHSSTGPAPLSHRNVARGRVLAAVAAVAAAVAFLSVGASRQSRSGEPARQVPLTSLPGVVASPSLSPDGSYVVFTWNGPNQDNRDLYVQQIGAGSPMRLTTDSADDFSPSWSPDGYTVAFLRRDPAGDRNEVRLIAPLGGSERKVAEVRPRLPLYRPLSLSWCPDSTCVLVTDSPGDGGPDAVFMIALATGEKRQLTHPPATIDLDGAISPDGRWLIFRRDLTPFSGAFYRVALIAGVIPQGDPVRLTSSLRAGRAAWTPDSREVVFAADGWLWRLDALNGGSPVRLPFVGQDGQSPVVSSGRDGRQRLVYVRSFADTNVWRVDVAAAGGSASAPPLRAVASTRVDTTADVSPDGLQLAFMSGRSGDFEIWTSAPDGANALKITALRRLPGFPRWSPDGREIAFHADANNRPDVVIVPAGGGMPRVLTEKLPNGGFPRYSRDGRWIYFNVVQDGEGRIWKIPVAGGAAVRVTSDKGTIAIESYDGRDLYYADAAEQSSAVWRLSLVEDGAPAKVLGGVEFGNFDVVPGGIYYIDRVGGEAGEPSTVRSRGETRLRYFDFTTGRSTTVAESLGEVSFGLSASRDGRQVFFSRVDSSVNELIVADVFR